MIKRGKFNRSKALCCALGALFLFAVTVTGESRDDRYHFPVRGGMEEWKAFTSHAQMLEACMVPDGILATMSTEGLIKTCMDYPLKNDLGNYNDFQMGFECVTRGFNGLQDLLKRKDTGTKLLVYYRSMKPGGFNRAWSLADKGFYAFDIMFVEMILAQDQVLGNLTVHEQKELLVVCIKKAEERTDYLDIYDDSRFHVGWALLVVKLLQKQNYQPANGTISTTDYDQFLKYGSTNIDNSFLQEIHYNGKAFLDPSIMKRGYTPGKCFLPATPRGIMKDTTILTPNGSSVRTNVKHSETESTSQLKSWFAANERDYPLIVPLEPFASRKYGTSKFNCHSYGVFWEDVEPEVNIWLNDVRPFVDDGSLEELSDTVHKCRIVLWKDGVGSYPLHTMPLIPNEGRQCTSKWGNNAVYAHDYDYHCYNPGASTAYSYPYDITTGPPYDPTDINVKKMFADMPFAPNVKVVNRIISVDISEPTRFAVYNMAGKLVYKETLFKTKGAVLDLTKCSTGIYAIKQTSRNKGMTFYKVAISD